MQHASVVRTNFECANPILNVADMSRSVRYYVEVLGFTNAEWGGDDFTCVTRDNAAIYFSEGDQGQPGTWAWIGVGMKVADPDGHVLRFGSDPKQGQRFNVQKDESN